MNPNRLISFAKAITLIFVGVIAGAQLSQSKISLSTSNLNHSESTKQAIIAALTQQIAKVEVERVIMGEILTQESPDLITLKEEQARLEKRLVQLNSEDTKNLVTAAKVSALISKIAEVEVEYAKNQARFTDQNPTIQLQKAQIASLNQRLMTLK